MFGEDINRILKHNLKVADTQENKLYNVGMLMSPLAYFFVYDAIMDAKKNGFNNIYYQTREGEQFILYHQIIEEINGNDFEIPKADLIKVSRVATFAASCDKFDKQNLLRLWNQYSNQSIYALFISLGINFDKIPDSVDQENDIEKEYGKEYLETLIELKKYIYPLCEKLGIDVKKKIENIAQDPRVLKLLADQQLVDIMQKILDRKRNDFKQYLSVELSMDKEPESIYIVDIGWRGTIQDNIAHILKHTKVYGSYIALFEFLNDQKEEVIKHSLINDYKFAYEFIDPPITFFETIFNSDSGSVVGYKDGKAIRLVKKEESKYSKEVISNIQEGMRAGSRLIAQYLKDNNLFGKIPDEEYRDFVKQLIRQTKKHPSKEVVDVYYNVVHNDTFGTGEFVMPKKELTWKDKLNPKLVIEKLRKALWKEAYVRKNGLYLYFFAFHVKQWIKKYIFPVLSFIKRGIWKCLSLVKRALRKVWHIIKKILGKDKPNNDVNNNK